ncbi:hypothetical protein [Bacillus thuringiensis]|uniref:hypothetical protein n=1 Tax=Bacillus thuringiensis TaxID=1428 RepID=UPI0021D66FFE|nr:hypothetical protein [Bacillus thuringiensis]MCU7666989.1 hypothetical protein [Bacillus thuringiensis]
MAVKIDLKEKYKNLSESNRQTIFYMAKLIQENGAPNSKNGGTGDFIEKVTNDLKSEKPTKPTVQRLYYTYITKHSPEELTELSTYFNEAFKKESEEQTIELNDGEDKKRMLLFKNKMIPVYEEEGKFYFVVDELVDTLPVSRSNKALKNSLSVKGRKLLEIEGQSQQCIDAEKVKAFLQSFLRQVQEGQQKEEIRYFVDKVHQLSLKNGEMYAEPVVQELRPIPNEVKAEIQNPSKVMIFKEEVTTPTVKIEEQKPVVTKVEAKKKPAQSSTKESEVVSGKDFSILKELKTEIAKSEVAKPQEKKESTFNIDETEEMKSLTKILNNSIGYLSPEAKNKLYNLTMQNGLVNTVVATMGMLEGIQKDTSLYFVNKIEEQLKECL